MLNAHFNWRRALKISTLLGLAVSGGAAFAASDWTVGKFSDAKVNGGCATIPGNTSINSGYGNSVSCQTGTVGGNSSINFSIKAWSTTGLPSSTTVNSKTGTDFETANLAWYSGGFGVRNRSNYGSGSGTSRYKDWNSSDGNHSMDNSGQTDLIMLSFSSPIVLESVLLGWGRSDSDISVMRYVGSSSSPSPLNLTASGLTSVAGGWELVGHYLGTANSGGGNLAGSNALRLTGAANNVASPDSSSSWLISAYNASYGVSGKYGAQTGFDTVGADMVKVLGIAGSAPVTNKTPEPGSLALIGLAFAGMLAIRKRGTAAPV